MNEAEEQAYTQGHRAAWRSMLAECLKQLGYDDESAASLRYIVEREDAIAQLRTICEHCGDNEWDESLHVGDIIEKHLARHLLK